MTNRTYPSGAALVALPTFDWVGVAPTIALLAEGAEFDPAHTSIDDLDPDLILATAPLAGLSSTITGSSNQYVRFDADDPVLTGVQPDEPIVAFVIYQGSDGALLVWEDEQGEAEDGTAFAFAPTGPAIVRLTWGDGGVLNTTAGQRSRTWSFATDLEGLVDAGLSSVTNVAFTASGDPAGDGGAIEWTTVTSGPTQAERAIKPVPGDTFEELFGVPPGANVVVAQVQGGSRNTLRKVGASALAYTIELWADDGNRIHGAGPLISGSALAASPGWVALASSSRSIDAAYQPSDTPVRLMLTVTITASGTVDVAFDLDEIQIRVQHRVVAVPTASIEVNAGPWESTITLSQPVTSELSLAAGGPALISSDEPRIFRDLQYWPTLEDPDFEDTGAALVVSVAEVSVDLVMPPNSQPVGWTDWKHGGGYARGDKSSQYNVKYGGLDPTNGYYGNLPAELAKQGIAVFVANYPLSRYPKGENLFPVPELIVGHLHDWIREHAPEWGLDPDNGATGGGSAGAGFSYKLAALDLSWIKAVIGASGDTYDVPDPGIVPPYTIHQSEILNHFGCIDGSDPECVALIASGSARLLVDEGMPPTLILNSSDESMPASQATGLDDRLTELGTVHVLYINDNPDPDNVDPTLAGQGQHSHASYPPTIGFPTLPSGREIPDGTPMTQVYAWWLLDAFAGFLVIEPPAPPAETFLDVKYGVAPDGSDLRMDIYRPEGAGPFPAVVTFPGTNQSRSTLSTLVQTMLVSQGFVVGNADYPANANLDQQYGSAQQALAFLRTYTDADVDPVRMAAFGTSRGGILAERMAIEHVLGLKAAASWSGSLSSLATIVDVDSMPLFIAHSTDDHTVPFAASQAVYDAYVTDGVDVELLEKAGAVHGLGLQQYDDVKQGTVEWLVAEV